MTQHTLIVSLLFHGSLLKVQSSNQIMAKVITVIGVTGNQGGSVAQRFLQDSKFHVRGITRNPNSPAAEKLATQGVEIVKADLDDVSSLVQAFHGSNLIFSVTNYWSVT